MKTVKVLGISLVLSILFSIIAVPVAASDDVMRVGITDGFGGHRFNFEAPLPFIDENLVAMFPLVHFDLLFRDGLNYEVHGDTVTITKNVLDITTVVSITVGSNILTRNEEKIQIPAVPIRKDGTIYFPLEYVGEAMGYRLLSDDRFEDRSLRFIQFTSFFVYVWNEYENSSPEGLRFSYVISGENIINISEIKERSTADVEEVFTMIRRLPKGSEVLSIPFYRITGYKIPWEIFDDLTTKIGEIVGMRHSAWSFGYLLEEIPPIITKLDDWSNRSYSESLFALGEEAIYNSSRQVYRFYNQHRRFLDIFVVRIEINDDGTANVYYKAGDGPSGPHSGGGLLRNKQATLNEGETQEFLALLDKVDFWNLPTSIDHIGFGGNDVLFEGIKDGEYHIVYRWVPRESDPFYNIEKYFRTLIKEQFTDISSWAREGISEAIAKGFVPTEIQSNYTSVITRSEFCRMAIMWVEYATGKSIDAILTERGLSSDPNAFTDTNDPDILAAFALGITSGTGDGKFTPDGHLSREQAAIMIMNTCRAIGANVDNPPDSGFADMDSASSWAVDGINFVKANGIMQGTGNNNFSPTAAYTREQSIITFNNINHNELPGR